MAYRIFDYGPTGRHLLVDDDGRLITNGDASESGYIYAYGDTGYPLLVDGAGRLLINPSGLDVAVSGNYYERNDNLIPAAADTYNVGADATRFDTLFAQSGNFTNGVQVGAGTLHLRSDGGIFSDFIYIPYGSTNIGIGSGTSALANLTTGSDNCAFGTYACEGLANTAYGCVGIGRNVMQEAGANLNIGIGYNALVAGSGSNVIAIGSQACQWMTSNSTFTIGIGKSAARNTYKNRFLENIAIGDQALEIGNGDSFYNIAIGYHAGRYLGGTDNIVIGKSAGPSTGGLITGDRNILIGLSAGGYHLSNYNVAIGFQAFYYPPDEPGPNNIAIGYYALRQLKYMSTECIAIGSSAGRYAGGSGIILMGNNTGYNNTGNYNILIGDNVVDTVALSGSNNTFIGANVETNTPGDIDYATAIGAGAVASGSNQIRLGRPEDTVHCENLMVQHRIQTGTDIQAATSGSYTVNWAKGHLTRITLDGDITFTFSNAIDGQKYILQIKQDNVGSHAVTWPAEVRWSDGNAPTLTTAASGVDYIGFIYDADDGYYDGVANSLNMQ